MANLIVLQLQPSAALNLNNFNQIVMGGEVLQKKKSYYMKILTR